jgi:hypothetical protein
MYNHNTLSFCALLSPSAEALALHQQKTTYLAKFTIFLSTFFILVFPSETYAIASRLGRFRKEQI